MLGKIDFFHFKKAIGLTSILVMFGVCRTVYAQPIQLNQLDPTYTLLSTLEPASLIDHGALSLGTLTKVRVKTLLDTALTRCQQCGYQEWIEHERQKFESTSSKKFKVNWIDEISMLNIATNQEAVKIENNGLDLLNARLQPLLMNENGRSFPNRLNSILKSSHSIEYSNRLFIDVQPQLTFNPENMSDRDFTFQRALMSFYLKNIVLEIGRDNIVWGNRYSGGLLFSNNAPPLNFFKISSNERFRLPWVFSKIGTFNFTTFISDLGKSFSIENAKMGAYRIDYQPIKSLTLGIEHSVTIGGKGLTSPNLIRAGGEFIGFVITPGDDAPSNHILGLNSSFVTKDWKFFGGVLFEDTDSNIDMFLNHNATWMVGAHKTNFAQNKNLDLWIELIRSSPRSFGHGIYLDGHTLDGKVLGFEIGPNAVSADFLLSYRISDTKFFQVESRLIGRLGNTYTIIRDEQDTFEDIIVVEYTPNENHYILEGQYRTIVNKSIEFQIELGVDYVSNTNFIQNNNRWDYVVGLGMAYHPFAK